MKDRILFAAAQEMNERGVKFTIDSVASRLGISKKTVYQHYASKEVLIGSIVEAALKDVERQKQEAMESQSDFVRKLTAVVTSEPKMFGKINYWVIDDIKRYYPAEWERINSFRRGRTKEIARILDEGIATGDIRPINTAIGAQILLSSCADFLDYRFLDENNITFGDALQALNDIFQYGVLTKPASEDAR